MAPDTSPVPAGTRPRPSRFDLRVGLLFGALILAFLALDALLLDGWKNDVCTEWEARGYEDCAGGDGFREWFPIVVVRGIALVLIEATVLVFLAFGVGSWLRRRAERSGGADAPASYEDSGDGPDASPSYARPDGTPDAAVTGGDSAGERA